MHLSDLRCVSVRQIAEVRPTSCESRSNRTLLKGSVFCIVHQFFWRLIVFSLDHQIELFVSNTFRRVCCEVSLKKLNGTFSNKIICTQSRTLQ